MGSNIAKAKYHVFLSYAHFDNSQEQWVADLVRRMETLFRSTTGQPLQLFMDVRKIDTAQIWEQRIRTALESSAVMVAVLSPSYFTSEWCGREWDHFVTLEHDYRTSLGLAADQRLIFPLKLKDWSKTLRPTADAQRRVNEAKARQYLDFEGYRPSESGFDAKVEELIDNIVSVLQSLVNLTSVRTSPSYSGASLPTPSPSSSPKYDTTQAVVRLGTNREQFIERFSQAVGVTLVGATHSKLVEYLDEALTRKRSIEGPNAFWRSLRIVFPSEAVLSRVHDDLLARSYPSREAATRERIRNAGRAKHSILYRLIRENPSSRWSLYEYDYILPFVGAIFEMGDGQKLVQIATIRPGYSTSEHLFFEFANEASRPHGREAVTSRKVAVRRRPTTSLPSSEQSP